MTQLFAGLVAGSILLLATVGFVLVRRVEGFLNIAHAQLLIVSGFAAYYFNVTLQWPLVISGILAVLVTAALGVVTARLIFWRMAGDDHVIPLIASVGLAFLLAGTVELLGGQGVQTLRIPPMAAVTIGGVRIAGPDQLAVILMAGLSVVLLHIWLTRTYTGKAMRAMANDRDLAALRGVDTERLRYIIWAVASGLAGLAGVAFAATSRVYPEMGWDQILLIVTAAIVGGLGSIYGVMVAAVLIGVGASLSTLVIPHQYAQVLVFGLIIVVLFLRPQGLSSDLKGRDA